MHSLTPIWGNRDKHKSRIESPIPKIPNCFCAQLFLLQKRNSRHVSVKNHLHNACSERRKESPWLQYTKSTYVRNRGKKSLIFAAIFPKSDAGGVLFTETRFKGTRAELRLLGPCLALMCGLHFTIISLSTCYWCSMYGLYKGCLQVIPSFFTQTRNWILFRCIGPEDWAHEHYFNILSPAEFWI